MLPSNVELELEVVLSSKDSELQGDVAKQRGTGARGSAKQSGQ